MRRDGIPVHIASNGEAQTVEPFRLGKGLHDEAWLQKLVHRNPSVLPIQDIEPGFGRMLPVAMEVPCKQGSIDNVLVSPDGDIAICEMKLWRNPQARREVVAQCLDYIAAISAMTYEEFESACLAGQTSSEGRSLFGMIYSNDDGLEEASFIDAVSANLKRGRILALAVGDGIRSQTETLANLLSRNASSQFSFALVELSIYPDQHGGYFVLPSTLSKTEMVSREVIIPVYGPTTSSQGVPQGETSQASVSPSGSISETKFFEAMAQRSPELPDALRRFLRRLEPLGVYPEWKASLNLYRDDPNSNRPLNAGYIQKNGQFYTSTAGWFGREKLALRYHKGVADLIGGEIYRPSGEWHDYYATTNGKSAPRIEQLIPKHEDALVKLISEYLERALSSAQAEQ
jgi:hypothetical protein